ncbi:hypothetical protein NDU88_009748, partial [Pleurodeles waltl]
SFESQRGRKESAFEPESQPTKIAADRLRVFKARPLNPVDYEGTLGSRAFAIRRGCLRA